MFGRLLWPNSDYPVHRDPFHPASVHQRQRGQTTRTIVQRCHERRFSLGVPLNLHFTQGEIARAGTGRRLFRSGGEGVRGLERW